MGANPGACATRFVVLDPNSRPSMRPEVQRWVPPSRRNRESAGGDPETERRGLEGLALEVSQVRLVVLQDDTSFDPASCPLDIEAQQQDGSAAPPAAGGAGPAAREPVVDAASGEAAADSAGGPEGKPGGVDADGEPGCSSTPASALPSFAAGASFSIFHPERLPGELLRWFQDALPPGAARLEFPASLSKAERARWHQAAERLHLSGQSVGIGDARYLTITSAPPAAWDRQQVAAGQREQRQGGGRAWRHRGLSWEQVERARFIWNCCQMEGGKHWERSQGEIEAMVASGEPLPQDLQALVDKRLRGEEVHRLLKAGQPNEALALLSEDPQLAWVKDGQTGGYAIHQAVWKGYEQVVLFLASLPGVLEQRDGRRDTPLAVARRRRNSALEELLLEAGAKPEHASFAQEPSAAPPKGPSGGGGWRAGAAAQGEQQQGRGVQGQEGEEEEEYVSWTDAERMQYRLGGEGSPPPGLQGRGRGRGRSSGRHGGGRYGGPVGWGGRGGPPPGERPPQQRSNCPW